MAKSDWRKLEQMLADYAEADGYAVYNVSGDIKIDNARDVNLTTLAKALANHVTLTHEPIQAKS